MAIALVAMSAVARATTDPTSAAIDTIGANLLIGTKTEHGSATPGTFSDDLGNTWNPLTVQDSGAGGIRIQMFWSIPTSVGSSHTVANTGTSVLGTVSLSAFSGAHATAPYDSPQENGALNGSTSALQTGNVTPSQNGSLIFTGFGFDVASGGVSINLGFSTPVTTEPSGAERGGSIAYLIQGTAAGVNPTWSTVNLVGAGAVIAVFKPSTDVPAAIIFKHA